MFSNAKNLTHAWKWSLSPTSVSRQKRDILEIHSKTILKINLFYISIFDLPTKYIYVISIFVNQMQSVSLLSLEFQHSTPIYSKMKPSILLLKSQMESWERIIFYHAAFQSKYEIPYCRGNYLQMKLKTKQLISVTICYNSRVTHQC